MPCRLPSSLETGFLLRPIQGALRAAARAGPVTGLLTSSHLFTASMPLNRLQDAMGSIWSYRTSPQLLTTIVGVRSKAMWQREILWDGCRIAYEMSSKLVRGDNIAGIL